MSGNLILLLLVPGPRLLLRLCSEARVALRLFHQSAGLPHNQGIRVAGVRLLAGEVGVLDSGVGPGATGAGGAA